MEKTNNKFLKINNSPVGLTIGLLSKKWTYEVLDVLLFEEKKFSEIEELYTQMSGKMLSRRLKDLFELGLISKVISKLSPLEFVYRITETGMSIKKVFYEMSLFGTHIFRDQVLGNQMQGSKEIEHHFQQLYFKNV